MFKDWCCYECGHFSNYRKWCCIGWMAAWLPPIPEPNDHVDTYVDGKVRRLVTQK